MFFTVIIDISFADLCPVEPRVPPQPSLRLGSPGHMSLLPNSLALQTQVKVTDKTTVPGEGER